MKTIGIICLFAITLLSCTEEDEIIGRWKDNIKLSTKSLSFDSGINSATITTKGEGWWINSIELNGKVYQYFNSETIDMEKDSYKIVEDDFSFERIEKTTIVITMNENLSQKDQLLTVTFQAGNYFDYLFISQSK